MKYNEVQLSDVCNLIAGFAFKGKHFGNYKDKVIKIANITPPTVSMSNLVGVDLSQYNSSKLGRFVAHTGDYVLAMTGATIGKIGRIELGEAYINQRVLLFRNNKDKIDKDFLYYTLQQYEFEQYVLSHIDSESAQPNISAGTIGKYRFHLPCMGSQIKIGRFLRMLDEKIELNQKINENLERQAFALFDNLLAGAQNEECVVSDIAILNPKRSLAKDQSARCIDMTRLPTSGAFPTGWETKPFNGGMKFSNGDTLLARITPCLENGKTAFIDFLEDGEVAFGSTEYIVLAPKEGIPPEFLYCLARYPAFVDYAVKNMNGSSGRQRVSAETIGQYRLPKLERENFEEFGKIVVPLFMKMRYNSLENMRLAAIRDTILPKLMVGEIDVSTVQV